MCCKSVKMHPNQLVSMDTFLNKPGRGLEFQKHEVIRCVGVVVSVSQGHKIKELLKAGGVL